MIKKSILLRIKDTEHIEEFIPNFSSELIKSSEKLRIVIDKSLKTYKSEKNEFGLG